MVKWLISALLSLILGSLKEFVIRTVETLNSTDLTNEEKRAEAFRLIKEHIKTMGREFRESLINLAIELAVQYLKKS